MRRSVRRIPVRGPGRPAAGVPVLLLAIAATAAAAAPAVPDTAALATMIRELTAPALAGRGAGTAQEHEAARLVATWLQSAGLEPAFGGQWLQVVPLPPSHGGESVNVGGVAPGRGALADRWILIGAHLDHLGRVDPEATGLPGPGQYYPGAGDNAAGIAALLSVARAAVRDGCAPGARRSLLVCAFGAEEIGLVGSTHLAANLPLPAARLEAMVNLDAIGRLGHGPLHVAGLESCAEFPRLLRAAAEEYLALVFQDAGLLSSDHASFLVRGVPSLFLFTSPYVEMNSPADSLSAVDLAGLARVAATTERLIESLRRVPGPLVFTPAATVPPAADAGNRRTWLGTVPDFTVAGGGYRIGDLAPSGPAAAAGLLVGDLVVRLGGQPVTDLATFTAALRRHAPKDVVEVLVERQGRRLAFPVTLGDRDRRRP